MRFYNILQIYGIRTLNKHLEKWFFNSVWKRNEHALLHSWWIHCGQLSSVCLLGFSFYKDVNARAISHVIIAAEHTWRTSGNRSIWSARVLAAVPNPGKFFCLWTCPHCLQTWDVHSFAVRADPKYFWGFSQKLFWLKEQHLSQDFRAFAVFLLLSFIWHAQYR